MNTNIFEPATSQVASHPVMNWLVETLRQNPEIAIFLALAMGFFDRRRESWKVQFRQRDWRSASRRSDWSVEHHNFTECEVGVLSDVPLRGRLQRRATIFPRLEERRTATSILRHHRVCRLPSLHLHRGQIGRL